MPRGAPRIWTDDYYKRIVQVPGRVIILTERNMQYRQIFTDGRPLPDDQNPTWNGYSSAMWDGDTLVVRTSGFRDDLCRWMHLGIRLETRARVDRLLLSRERKRLGAHEGRQVRSISS